MGSSSIYHGLSKVKHTRPKSNVAARVRKARLNSSKQALLDEIKSTLKDTSEIA